MASREVIKAQYRTDKDEVLVAIVGMTTPFSTFEQNGYSQLDGLSLTKRQMLNALSYFADGGDMDPRRKNRMLEIARNHTPKTR